MIVVISNGRKCSWGIVPLIKSVVDQGGEWRMVITIDDVDRRGDAVICDSVKIFQPEIQRRITTVFNSQKKGHALNTMSALKMCAPGAYDIIAFVDADDRLLPGAFYEIKKAYAHDALVTYGSYKTVSGTPARFCGRYGKNVRTSRWRGSHLKTVRYDHFTRLSPSNFIMNGRWILAGSDIAMMIPLIEMAGPSRARFIDKVIYEYNDVHDLRDDVVNRAHQKEVEKWVRSQPPMEEI